MKKYILKIETGILHTAEIPFDDLSMARNTADVMTAALEESCCDCWSVSVEHSDWEDCDRKVFVDGSKVQLL